MQKQNNYKLIIWDWLGTLVELSKGAPLSFFQHQFFSENKLMNEKVSKIKEDISKMQVWFKPYAWNLVNNFHKSGLKQAIASNSYTNDILLDLAYAPFKEFDLIIGVSSKLAPKPSPDMINFACSKLGFEKNEVVFIGDSETDFQAAKNAGVDFLKVDSSIESYFKVLKAIQN
jgi:HAD superfamily hydrolase (TIGR01549 family)